MPSTIKVLNRIRQRVADLSKNFAECLDYFDGATPFVGPSNYFYQKALAKRLSHSSIESLLQDDLFFDWLYATLTAWGLHRMGPGNAKLRDIQELRASFREQANAIEKLAPLTITSLKPQDTERTANEIWDVLSSLRISIAEAQIVANSKALHVVLHNLLPPIDREYTFRFFYDRNNLSVVEKDAFVEMYVEFCGLATRNTQEIVSRIGKGWHTSESKIIDNAIIGYMLRSKQRQSARANPAATSDTNCGPVAANPQSL